MLSPSTGFLPGIRVATTGVPSGLTPGSAHMLSLLQSLILSYLVQVPGGAGQKYLQYIAVMFVY